MGVEDSLLPLNLFEEVEEVQYPEIESQTGESECDFKARIAEFEARLAAEMTRVEAGGRALQAARDNASALMREEPFQDRFDHEYGALKNLYATGFARVPEHFARSDFGLVLARTDLSGEFPQDRDAFFQEMGLRLLDAGLCDSLQLHFSRFGPSELLQLLTNRRLLRVRRSSATWSPYAVKSDALCVSHGNAAPFSLGVIYDLTHQNPRELTRTGQLYWSDIFRYFYGEKSRLFWEETPDVIALPPLMRFLWNLQETPVPQFERCLIPIDLNAFPRVRAAITVYMKRAIFNEEVTVFQTSNGQAKVLGLPSFFVDPLYREVREVKQRITRLSRAPQGLLGRWSSTRRELDALQSRFLPSTEREFTVIEAGREAYEALILPEDLYERAKLSLARKPNSYDDERGMIRRVALSRAAEGLARKSLTEQEALLRELFNP